MNDGGEGFVTIDDGCRLRYRIDGSAGAPPLLLSNSLGTTVGMWDAQLGPFARHFRVIRYDTRGHGESGGSATAYPLARLGMDAVGLLDALGVARTSFCGLSLGGMVGQWLGAHAGERIERLVLANTAALLGPPAMWETRISAVREGGMSAIVPAVLERWFTSGFRERRPADVARIAAMLAATPAAGYTLTCAAIRDMDLRAELADIRPPVLVVVGTQDVATPPRLGEAIAGSIARAKLIRLSAAHLSNIEQPEQFGAEVLAFLTAAKEEP